MGHITITGEDLIQVKAIADLVKVEIKIKA